MKNSSRCALSKTSPNKKETRYAIIKKEIDTTWPAWKKEAYNNNFATSAHAKKYSV